MIVHEEKVDLFGPDPHLKARLEDLLAEVRGHYLEWGIDPEEPVQPYDDEKRRLVAAHDAHRHRLFTDVIPAGRLDPLTAGRLGLMYHIAMHITRVEAYHSVPLVADVECRRIMNMVLAHDDHPDHADVHEYQLRETLARLGSPPQYTLFRLGTRERVLEELRTSGLLDEAAVDVLRTFWVVMREQYRTDLQAWVGTEHLAEGWISALESALEVHHREELAANPYFEENQEIEQLHERGSAYVVRVYLRQLGGDPATVAARTLDNLRFVCRTYDRLWDGIAAMVERSRASRAAENGA
jgi:hypothetical protein